MREPRRGESDLLDAARANPLFSSFLTDPPDKLGFWASLRHIWRIRSLRMLIFTNAAFGFSLFGVGVWIPTFFERKYGFSTEGAAGVLGFLALGAFSWHGTGTFADKFAARLPGPVQAGASRTSLTSRGRWHPRPPLRFASHADAGRLLLR